LAHEQNATRAANCSSLDAGTVVCAAFRSDIVGAQKQRHVVFALRLRWRLPALQRKRAGLVTADESTR
jgi:hypothetical protein